MNIQQAREKIKQTMSNNPTELDLSSLFNDERLTSKDLTELLPRIKELENLKTLYLSHNQISNIEALGQLTSLTELYLSHNQISNIEVLEQLTSLTILYLGSNQIRNVEGLGQLTELTELDLKYNRIHDANALEQLTKLRTLYLIGNQLTNVDFLRRLKNLQYLHLSGNKELYKKIPGDILSYYRNPLRIIASYFSIEESVYQLYEDTPEKLWEFIDSKTARPQENKALLECRVVLIGQGNAGKTSLRQRLLDLPFEDKGKTEGVEIEGKHFKIRDESVRVNIWDFGGQEVYHTTHKFFFRERCLYILVVDVRAGMEKYIVKYWLYQIKELAKNNAPLIIVANKAECKDKPLIDETYKYNFESLLDEFKEIYSNIKSIHYVSTNMSLNTAAVKQDVIESIDKDLPEVFSTYPLYYSKTRELFDVEKTKFRNFISKEEFEKQISEEARNDKKVVEILDILGVLCHFKQNENETDDELEKMYVLNPEWITKGVYKILSSYILGEKKGRVELSDIKSILNKSEYEERHIYIIKLMQRFKLCFRTIEQEKEFIIFPTLLPIEEKGYDYFSGDLISFGYKYFSESEMEKAITTFIVDNHKGNKENKFWRRGILIHKKDLSGKPICRILVKADVKTEIITITIEGEKAVRESNLSEIKDYFTKYHQENDTQVNEGKLFEIENSKNINFTSPQVLLNEQFVVLKNRLDDKNTEQDALISRLKSFIDELSQYRARPKTNLISYLITLALTTTLFLSFYNQWSIIVSYISVFILILQVLISNSRLKEWSILKAPEQILESEKKKIINDLGFNEEQQKLLK